MTRPSLVTRPALVVGAALLAASSLALAQPHFGNPSPTAGSETSQQGERIRRQGACTRP